MAMPHLLIACAPPARPPLGLPTPFEPARTIRDSSITAGMQPARA